MWKQAIGYLHCEKLFTCFFTFPLSCNIHFDSPFVSQSRGGTTLQPPAYQSPTLASKMCLGTDIQHPLVMYNHTPTLPHYVAHVARPFRHQICAGQIRRARQGSPQINPVRSAEILLHRVCIIRQTRPKAVATSIQAQKTQKPTILGGGGEGGTDPPGMASKKRSSSNMETWHTALGRPHRRPARPMSHTSTPSTPNFSPSSLSGSFPKVRHRELTPLSSESLSHRP